MLNRAKCKDIREALENHMSSFNYGGVSVSIGRGSFTDTVFTIKLDIATDNSDGSQSSKEAEDFKFYCRRYGMTESDLGRTFKTGQDTFTILGCKPRATKNTIVVTNQNGKRYVMPHSRVKFFLALDK